jgi:hypothetical protein
VRHFSERDSLFRESAAVCLEVVRAAGCSGGAAFINSLADDRVEVFCRDFVSHSYDSAFIYAEIASLIQFITTEFAQRQHDVLEVKLLGITARNLGRERSSGTLQSS